MRMENIKTIQKSFSVQAKNFESKQMNFSKQEFLDDTVLEIDAQRTDRVLEVAAGLGVCGRSLAPFMESVTCLDATAAMLQVGKEMAEKENLKNIRFVEGFAEKLPYPDAAVLSSLPEDGAALCRNEPGAEAGRQARYHRHGGRRGEAEGN